MMRVPLMFILVTLNACTSLSPIPTVKELDWNPPQIFAKGCPDLTGRYIAPDAEDYRWIFPKDRPEKGLYGGNHKIYQRDKGLDIVVTVESRPNGIFIHANNGRNHVESFTPYDGVMVGCHEGVLVSRFIGPRGGGGETGGCTFFTYGERRTRLNQNGDIEVVYNQRERCGTFGAFKTLPVTKNYPGDARPYVFRRVQAAPPPASP